MSATDADERLARATALFVKQASISEVSKKIAQSVDESLSKQQKEFFLRQQLAAIQRELANLSRSSHSNNSNNGNSNPTSNNSNISVGGSSPLNGANLGPVNELDDDEQAEVDDLAEVKAKILAMAVGSEERKMGAREFKRLKRIPQGSVEHGVIRNYVRVSPITWFSSTDDILVLLNRKCSWNGSLRFPGLRRPQHPQPPRRSQPSAPPLSSPPPAPNSMPTISDSRRSRNDLSNTSLLSASKNCNMSGKC